MANSWFSPHGSKRLGMSSASQPAIMRCATGMEKPTCGAAPTTPDVCAVQLPQVAVVGPMNRRLMLAEGEQAKSS